MARKPKVVFFVPPGVTPLDLAGPWQVFILGNYLSGYAFEIEICGLTTAMPVANNLHFANLSPIRRVKFTAQDILFVTGFSTDPTEAMQHLRKDPAVFAWIRAARQAGATVCSICTGAYLLAESGILDGAACATHWRDIGDLQKKYPKVEVRKEILFVESNNIFSSAGIASGIDLAIHLLALRYGPKIAFEVARMMVIYLRRGGDFEQESIYLQYRNHLDDVVHRAQTFLIEHLARPPSLEQLAERVGSSARNLSRRFRQNLGLTIGQYQRELRLEQARTLLREEGSKVAEVARACGFRDPRQLRNLFRQRYGRSPRGELRTAPARV